MWDISWIIASIGAGHIMNIIGYKSEAASRLAASLCFLFDGKLAGIK